MTKLILLLLLSTNAFAGDIFITKDTTVNDRWNIPATTVVHFQGGRILGEGTVNGGIIDAAYTQHIFDTLLTVTPSAMYNTYFSLRWFGASPTLAPYRNATCAQKAIDLCRGMFPLFCPRGWYVFNRTLRVEHISNGTFAATSIHMIGEANYWDEGVGNGTYFTFTNKNIAGISLQYNKGTEIEHIVISGQYKVPSLTGAAYFAQTYAEYSDPTCSAYYSGIAIDFSPNQNGSSSGSSGIHLHDLIIRGFTVNISHSFGGTLNADCLLYENILFGDCKVCVLSTQGQEKGNIMRNMYCWSAHYAFFRSGLDGLNPAAGGWTIDGGNIVGGIEEFMIAASDWQPTNISNMFFESLTSIGQISTLQQLKITSCTFDFLENSLVGARVRLKTNTTTNPGGVVFDNCLFRLFGNTSGAIRFEGMAAFMNCKWYGTYVNENPAGRYQVTLPSGIRMQIK